METFWVAVDELITCLIAHLHVFHPVVVFRIADTDGRTHDQSGVPFHKLCVQVGTMCMEGTDAMKLFFSAWVIMLTAPPNASVPNEAGTTPL